MTDLKSPALMYLKAFMFLVILVVSAALILHEARSWLTLGLVLLVVWSSARLYYFMFYVIEKYIDSDYRFAGIGSFVAYVIRRRKSGKDAES